MSTEGQKIVADNGYIPVADTKAYDGTPLTKDEAVATGLLTGHTMSEVTVVGSQTLVGTSNNVASAAKILDENNVDVTANYAITYVDGTLTVTKGEIAAKVTASKNIFFIKSSYLNLVIVQKQYNTKVTNPKKSYKFLLS